MRAGKDVLKTEVTTELTLHAWASWTIQTRAVGSEGADTDSGPGRAQSFSRLAGEAQPCCSGMECLFPPGKDQT